MNSAAHVFESDSPINAATVSIIYQLKTTIPIDRIIPIIFNLFPLENKIFSIANGIARKIATNTEATTA